MRDGNQLKTYFNDWETTLEINNGFFWQKILELYKEPIKKLWESYSIEPLPS